MGSYTFPIACPGGPCGKEENRTADKDYQTGTYGRLLTVGTIHLGLTHGVMFPAAGFTVESQGMSGKGTTQYVLDQGLISVFSFWSHGR